MRICLPCLHPKWSLGNQLLWSFLTLAAFSLLLALGVVLGTAYYTGYMAQNAAKDGLVDQIERHLTSTSVEAAATIGERFRRLQYGVLDMTALAFRDAMKEDLLLADGTLGYPLAPGHTDLRDTEISSSLVSNLVDFERQEGLVDLGRSVWYYANATSPRANVRAVDAKAIEASARLDILWPTAYLNSEDTKGVYVAIELPSSNSRAFRHFPGSALSEVSGTLFACDDPDYEDECFDPAMRPWYQLAIDDKVEVSPDTMLGHAIMTEPYLNAIGSADEWLTTIARAVYNDSSSSKQLLGVVGMDLMLETVQLSIEEINFLTSGYSMLATAEGAVVAAPSEVWNGTVTDGVMTVCELDNGICDEEDGWESFLESVDEGVYHYEFEGEENVLVAAPLASTFPLNTGDGDVTHYILSSVPKSEVYEPADGMEELVQESMLQILITTGMVAGATLLVVAVAVCFLSGAIVRPIKRMTGAAESISRSGAKTDVFGSAVKSWVGRERGNGTTSKWEYLVCRGDDEIKLLGREFTFLITGLGMRGRAARAVGLENIPVYPTNPFTTPQLERLVPTAPVAPQAPTTPRE